MKITVVFVFSIAVTFLPATAQTFESRQPGLNLVGYELAQSRARGIEVAPAQSCCSSTASQSTRAIPDTKVPFSERSLRRIRRQKFEGDTAIDGSHWQAAHGAFRTIGGPDFHSSVLALAEHAAELPP